MIGQERVEIPQLEFGLSFAETVQRIIDHAVTTVRHEVHSEFDPPWTNEEMTEQVTATFIKLGGDAMKAGDRTGVISAMFETERALRRPLQDEAEEQKNSGMARQFPIPLVGEQHYQTAVCELNEGDEVSIVRELGNPYDTRALAVRDGADRNIGYIPRDSFLRDAIHEERKGCRAWIEELEADRRGQGFTHVLVMVELCEDEVPERTYAPA